MLLISLQYKPNNEESVAEENWLCHRLAGEKCDHRQCSKVQVEGGQNEKAGRISGSVILLLGVTDSKIHIDMA